MNRIRRCALVTRDTGVPQGAALLFASILTAALLTASAAAALKVILISLDGATPRFINQFLSDDVLSNDEGVGLLQGVGVRALRNITVAPSLTAPGHIAIATGSTAATNDITANTLHLIASTFTANISGFAAAI